MAGPKNGITHIDQRRREIVVAMVTSKRWYPVIIEQDEDGVYLATVPSIDGCYTQGRTVEQALERAKEAILVCDNDDVAPPKFIDVKKILA